MSYLEGKNPQNRRLTTDEIFGIFDKDKSGVLSRNEFLGGLDTFSLDLTE